MKIKTSGIALALAATVMLSGCANVGPNPYGGQTYTSSGTRNLQQVYFGTVVGLAAARIVPGQNEQFLSTGIGAVAGGIAGSAAGGGKGQELTTLAGAVLGGLAGNAVGKTAGTAQGVTITVRLEDGRTVAITQGVDPNVLFKVGQKVEVLEEPGGPARVVPAAGG